MLNLRLHITPSGSEFNPNAYLKPLFYKQDGTALVSSLQIKHLQARSGNWQDLELIYMAPERGYIQVFVANVSDQEVFFDQMVVEHIPQLTVQKNHYYPFGLELVGLNKKGKPEHRWKYHSQEEQTEFGLNWSSFKYRNADVALGRFFSVDPLAEDYVYNSTYAFSENKVISHVELEGLESIAAMNKPDNRPLMLQTIPNSSKTQSNAIKRQKAATAGWKTFVKSRVGAALVGHNDSRQRLRYYKPRVARLEARYKTGKISAGQYAIGRYNAQKNTKMRQSPVARAIGEVNPFGKPLSKNAFKTRPLTTRLSKGVYYGAKGYIGVSAVLSVENIVTSDNKIGTTVQEVGGWTASYYGAYYGGALGVKVGSFFGPYGRAIGGFVLGGIGGGVSYFYGTEWIKSLQEMKVAPSDNKPWHESNRHKGQNASAICFIAGTQILMADGTNKNIEDVKVGDKVKTVNVKTFEIENQKVLKVDSPTHSNLIDIEFDDGTKNSNTFDHPYYVVGKGWCSYKPNLTKERYGLETQQLALGDTCYKFCNGTLIKVIINSMIENIREERTYNLSHIAKTHSFFANGILVHNKILNQDEHNHSKK